MSEVLIYAIVFISLALVFYTIGVWSEKIQGTLKGWHLVFFSLGLVFDTLGTSKMSEIAGGFSFSLHSITGGLAILLMGIHLLWAIYVLIKGDEVLKQKFHKFSIIVWLIWLIPYFIGMFIGMM